MATTKVRVSGYVDPELAKIIDDTAAALGQSRSAMVGEVLTNAAPVLEVLRDMGRALKEAPERHREALAMLAQSMAPMVDEAHAGLDSLTAMASTPAPSNTGVSR